MMILIETMCNQDFGALIFSDDFSSNTINQSKWSQIIMSEPYNNELQYYTDSNANAFIQDGVLHVKAIKENIGTKAYSSAKLTTENTKLFRYGKFEMEAKLPVGLGTWPAFWLFSPDATYSEIDIMEAVGAVPNEIWFNVHANMMSQNVDKPKVYKQEHHKAGVNVSDITSSFHTYSVEWTPIFIKGFVDGQQYFELNREDLPAKYWHFDQEMYVIVNLAVGGDWGGMNGICPDCFPQEMLVKSVKVYEYTGTYAVNTGLRTTDKIIIGVVVSLVLISVIICAWFLVKRKLRRSSPCQVQTKVVLAQSKQQ
ncbi:glycoside_hydrolase [Hexamita inflata]|uniref:Glycoside hydrolase n=1 Tax=Hexamita inflata TaxID=28002 RepID=A0AA86Q068_9EUKA|nr:glycoside hydrolase [Hexamita inflata]